MAQIDSTASNTSLMREHMMRKQMQHHQPQHEEDLCVCSTAVDFVSSLALNARQKEKIASQSVVVMESTHSHECTAIAADTGPVSPGIATSEKYKESKSILKDITEESKESNTVVQDSTEAVEECEIGALKNTTEPSEGSKGNDEASPESAVIAVATCGAISASALCEKNAEYPKSVPDGVVCSSEHTEPAPTELATRRFATFEEILRANPNDMCLVSDVDEQLLLKVSFKSPVRISSFAIRATAAPAGFKFRKSHVENDEEDDDLEETCAGPHHVKVFGNHSSLDFSNVNDELCAHSITLLPFDIESSRRLPLPGSKFHLCTSIHIFIEDNQADAPVTFLNKLSLYGYVHKSYA